MALYYCYANFEVVYSCMSWLQGHHKIVVYNCQLKQSDYTHFKVSTSDRLPSDNTFCKVSKSKTTAKISVMDKPKVKTI